MSVEMDEALQKRLQRLQRDRCINYRRKVHNLQVSSQATTKRQSSMLVLVGLCQTMACKGTSVHLHTPLALPLCWSPDGHSQPGLQCGHLLAATSAVKRHLYDSAQHPRSLHCQLHQRLLKQFQNCSSAHLWIRVQIVDVCSQGAGYH